MTISSIAVIGGTGAEGSGIALRLGRAGMDVVIGSRNAERACGVARDLTAKLQAAGVALREGQISGATSAEAVSRSDSALLTVPFKAQLATATDLAAELFGKILIDATAPLVPPKVWRVDLPDGKSAVAALQAALGEGVRVVAAFQNVSAHHLADLDHLIDCDVLVCGDDRDARAQVIELIGRAGMRGIHAGPIQNAAAVEAITALLIAINRHYKVPGAGVRVTGLPENVA